MGSSVCAIWPFWANPSLIPSFSHHPPVSPSTWRSARSSFARGTELACCVSANLHIKFPELEFPFENTPSQRRKGHAVKDELKLNNVFWVHSNSNHSNRNWMIRDSYTSWLQWLEVSRLSRAARQSLTVKPSIQMSTFMVVSWPSFGADFLGFSIFNQSQKQNQKKARLCFCHCS